MKNIIILSLAALLFFPSLGIADHLSNKSNAETLKMHKFRLDIMPIKFHTQIIPPHHLQYFRYLKLILTL